MKNQHTQGPWEADIRIAQATVVDSHGNAVADIARHEFSVTEQSYSDRRIEANAHLIAAAPTMYEALKTAEPYLRHANVAYNVYVQARAAIAKAEGA